MRHNFSCSQNAFFSLSLSGAACFDIVNKDVSPTNYSEFLLDLALQKAK